jgi:hypothetical protein
MRIEDAVVELSDVTVRNGSGDSDNCGGITNNGALKLTNVTVSQNRGVFSATGGGICNRGTLTMVNGTISDNSINSFYAGFGGGLANRGDASLTNVTISGNSAISIHPGGEGGGIYHYSGTLTLTNVTIANNTASDGGALLNGGTATLMSVTIAGNGNGGLGDGTGGISNPPYGGLTLKDTIVANSTPGANCAGSITSLDYNLDSDGTCGLTGPHDVTKVNPKLSPLQNNGGPTLTIALLPGSPAIDTGGADCPATDQRGVSRPQGAACDIGAYEADGTAAAACVGDCRAIGTVQIADILTLVNIALGNAEAAACPNGIPIGADVDITVILQGVNNALNGCNSGG